MNQEPPEGVIQSYSLRYLRRDNGLYRRLAFVDMSMERAMLREMMGSYLRIALAAFLLLLGGSVILARWATEPMERAWGQQRQFLSDASHELKTPLTVILSNAELLSALPLEERPARWTDNILSESQQMKRLVEEMLTLARADNLAQAEAYRDRQTLLRQWEDLLGLVLQEGGCFSLRQLAVRGGDLTGLGLEGPAVGRGLEALLDQVMDERLPNDREILLEYAKEKLL